MSRRRASPSTIASGKQLRVRHRGVCGVKQARYVCTYKDDNPITQGRYEWNGSKLNIHTVVIIPALYRSITHYYVGKGLSNES